MPPKKKKLPANPIVVGTVSTRSTRRQSIVNIEIPKSSRSKKKGKGIAKTGLFDKELIVGIRSDANEHAEAANSSLEYVFETSSESDKTDRSDKVDSSDTDTLIKPRSKCTLDEVTTESSTKKKNITKTEIAKSSKSKKAKGIFKATSPNKKAKDTKLENLSLRLISASSSESEWTDKSERTDSSDTDNLPKSELELRPDNVTESATQRKSIIVIEIPKNSKKKGKCITKTDPPFRKVITDVSFHSKGDAEAEHSSLALISDSSSESKTIGGCETVEIDESRSKVRFEDDTEPLNSESFAKKIKYSFSKAIKLRSTQSDSTKDGEESKQALLQILQDWDDEDEESQGQNTELSKFVGKRDTAKIKGYENLEFGAEDITDIMGKDVNSTSTTAIHNIDEMEVSLTENPHVIERGGDKSIKKDSFLENKELENSSSSIDVSFKEAEKSHNDEPVHTEESMDVTFEGEIVGCVIEEIVPNTTEEIMTISNIDNNSCTEPQVISDDSRDTANNTPALETCKDSQSVQNKDENVSEPRDRTLEVASEESQSMSTVDSNDAEVRGFFSKQICNDEVNEEISPTNGGSDNSNFENIALVEEQLIDNEIAISQDSVSIEGEIVEENDQENKIVSLGVQHEDMLEDEDKVDLKLEKEQCILSVLEDNSTEDHNVTVGLQEEQKDDDELDVQMNLDISETKNSVAHDVELQKEQDILSILEDDLEEDQNITASSQGANVVASEEQLPFVQLNLEPSSMTERDDVILDETCCEEQNQDRSMENQMERMILGEAPVVHDIGKNEDISTSKSERLEEPVMPTDNEKGTAAISIENRIAEMHLGNEKSVDKNNYEEVSQLNNQCGVTDSEGLPQSSSEENSEKVEMKEVKRVTSEKIKSPKINASSTGNFTKSPKFEKIPKQITPTKVKETKPRDKKTLKEPRIKKTPSPAPKKNIKNEKKEKSKIEKKEKKLGKADISKSDNDTDDTEVRRSSRIKFINDTNSTKKITGRGLVKSKSESALNSMDCDLSDNSSVMTESGRSTPVASPNITIAERKSRWSKSTDNISTDSQNPSILGSTESEMAKLKIDEKSKMPAKDPVIEGRLKQFVHLKENSYKTDRMTCKEAKKMICDCFLTADEIEGNEYGCGEDCLNRLLLIECGNLCQVGDRCTNKRFQKTQFAPVEVFNTDKKGLGLRAAANIAYGEFILEYVGEVLNSNEFDKRAEVYSQDKNIHYYFMALRADAIIDATMKGNISRFINHSCDPNAETQKWTVNGELRIGFFSTRTILAGEEVTFDYRFQRYGKEAQKCFCGASICRGWLGEEPDSDEDEEDEDEEESVGVDRDASLATPIAIKDEVLSSDIKDEPEDFKFEKSRGLQKISLDGKDKAAVTPVITPVARKRALKKKPRIELFEEIDQLNEEIEMLVSTGLKNQAQTLKLSRLVVRAKDPQQRAKLLRVLRRGELPCRRLFLDYHGLRLIHGYMIDAQQLVLTNKKYESMRLELLQTLAVLPIPNKSMLQDSKVLPTVELWASDKDLTSPLDSDSNSPKTEQDTVGEPLKIKEENIKTDVDLKTVLDQEEEIKFLANKLLEEWSNLKEVFKIPKKERIEQMKEHEREANKKFIQARNAYENEQDKEKKSDRYRSLSVRYKIEKDPNRKGFKQGDKPSAEFLKLSKVERRKLFALQHELREEERRLKQREMWRQHEMNCMMMGTDPRFTAPFDPSRGFHCVWNPQIGQWQNYPLPPNTSIYPSQTPPLPNISLPPHQIPKSMPTYSYTSPLPMNTNVGMGISQLPHGAMTGALQLPPSTVLPPMSSTLPPTAMPLVQYHEPIKEEDPSKVKFMGPIPPPVKLPPKWKCAKDKYGRPYYYHIRLRKSQWEPPPFVEPIIDENLDSSESESSSDTSSISSDSSSDNSESDVDDTQLLLEVRKQMDNSAKAASRAQVSALPKLEESFVSTPSPEDKNSDEDMELDESVPKLGQFNEDDSQRPSIDMRLKQLDLFKVETPPSKKRRVGLCEEIIISPRTEEDKKQFKEDMKRYKANKEKLKRQKELILQQTKKQLREIELKKMREKRSRTSLKSKIKDMPDFNSDSAKKIKETFRANMASTVVNSLNVYRKSDCMEGKITNTEDFKHLARKLTHFVMLKEMKHISKIEELTCTDSVKMKAREYIRKYMSKFGEVYIKRNDSPDFKD